VYEIVNRVHYIYLVFSRILLEKDDEGSTTTRSKQSNKIVGLNIIYRITMFKLTIPHPDLLATALR